MRSAPATAKVLAAAVAALEFDLVLAGIDTSDGGSGVVATAIATIRGLLCPPTPPPSVSWLGESGSSARGRGA